MSQADMRRQINEEIVAALRGGTPPWRKGWAAGDGGLPRNAATKARYSGINVLLLTGAQLRRGFASNRWATFRQWANLGGQVRKRPDDLLPGTWGTRVVVFKPQTPAEKPAERGEETKKRSHRFMRWFTVFNEDQVDGLRRPTPADTSGFVNYAPAEEAFRATEADIRHTDEGRAYYYRPGDHIVMPHRHRFVSQAEYYGTLGHEIAHWTECRLGWTGSYAIGELRAEVVSCYLGAELGIPQSHDRSNSAAYLAQWIQAMEADPGVIFHLATACSVAADYILSFSRPECTSDDPAEAATVSVHGDQSD